MSFFFWFSYLKKKKKKFSTKKNFKREIKLNDWLWNIYLFRRSIGKYGIIENKKEKRFRYWVRTDDFRLEFGINYIFILKLNRLGRISID
jgi:hypothetical protein